MDLLNFDIAKFVQEVTVAVIPFMLAVTVHEVSHGYVAYMLGDPTAKNAGRLTLNPIAHIDIVGLLFLLVTRLFGWAKPVPVDFRIVGRKKYGPLLVAAAGPVSNFILAVLSALALMVLVSISKAGYADSLPEGIWTFITLSFVLSVRINVVLGIFNLLPILPLDGGRIVHNLLPRRWAYQYGKLEPWGMIIIVVLLFTGVIRPILWPVMNTVISILMKPILGGTII